ncbi:hypothetical protein [Nostoc sp.]|uniref:hypothetical protein n=1 Tax=Nostoc sp. TaxID=1180 RepID=UPI002FF49508
MHLLVEKGLNPLSGVAYTFIQQALLGKNKFWMYDESPKFSGKLNSILTINAISENH